MPTIGATEWIIIAFIILLLFGGKKIPEFFKGLGEAVKEFKKSSRDLGEDEGKSKS
ncbi:MAG: twin-arginine translocase TatA/TatE family subunit [Candidatus Curtissbacteria bacterium]|nr:twin-arginine translocase TatA/TatE family subunit [Candidatus Curtissbacteria bacterium]